MDSMLNALSMIERKEPSHTISMVTPELERKFDEVIFGVRELTKHMQTLEHKIGDLNMRVSIAEVRLEERRLQSPQMLLPPQPVPARRGRKPKVQ